MRWFVLVVILTFSPLAQAAAAAPSRDQVCARQRGVCTMDYNPVVCKVAFKKAKKEIEVKGSNRCAAVDLAEYQACLAGDEIMKEAIACRSAAGSEL